MSLINAIQQPTCQKLFSGTGNGLRNFIKKPFVTHLKEKVSRHAAAISKGTLECYADDLNQLIPFSNGGRTQLGERTSC
jgi:hypothetical protein